MMFPQEIILLAGVFVAGAVSGATGFALPLIAGPVFLLAYAPIEAVALTALCSITGQIFSIALLRRAIAFEFRAPLIAAGILGVPLGSALLAHLSPSMLHLSFGALIAIAGVWGLLLPVSPTPRPITGVCEFCVGAAGGLTAGLVGASAVAPALWCAWCGLRKDRQRAIMQPYILVMQLASLVSLGTSGIIEGPLLHDYAIVLPPLLCGVAGGVACFHAVSTANANRAVLSVVTISGLALLLA
jgi:hypothetical protein